MDNPCYNCPKRYPGCHASCGDYKSWKAKQDEIKEKERKHRDALSYSPKPRFRKPHHATKIRGDR